MDYDTQKIFKSAEDYVIKNNKGDSNPYHNNHHMLDVFKNSMLLFDKYKNEFQLKSKDRLELGLACLFHDFNHSGGKLKDSDNIKLAIEGLEDFLNNDPFIFYKVVYSKEIEMNRNNIINIIKATEFPHTKIELNNLQKIIRDADMLSSIGDNWFEPVIALAAESKKSILQFIPILVNFVNSVKFYTPYCVDHLTNKREKMIKEILKLQSELTSYL